jgi:hypothetical protein
MYCETKAEQAVFELLKESYPGKNDYLMDLMAWVFVNRPERFNEIMEEHRKSGNEELVELENLDIKALLRIVPEE